MTLRSLPRRRTSALPRGTNARPSSTSPVASAAPADAKVLVLSATAYPNPVLYLEHKALYRSQRGPVDEGLAFVPLGKADVRRRGTELSVITYGMMVHRCLEAADAAAAEGVEDEVSDLRTLLPLDLETLT